MKICKDCEADISNRGNRAVRCIDCQQEYRQKYNQNMQELLKKKYDLRNGSRSPFKVDGEGCGNNNGGRFPQKIQVWMHYWIDMFGEPNDLYLKERGSAIDKLNKEISNIINTNNIKKRSRAQVYSGWEY